MITHRTLDGGWAECANPEACSLKFHLPDVTPQQASTIPFEVLLPLLEVVEPYTSLEDYGAVKIWQDQWGRDHRDYDLPSGVDEDGTLYWYQHGQMHRDHDRPALVLPNGVRHWYQEGKLHRVGGPALVVPGSYEAWYQRGVVHRDDGPAVIQENGVKEWWEHGHSIKVQLPDGTFMNPREYRQSEYYQLLNTRW